MNSLQIKYFLALAKYLNFTKTAKHLFVSQPAISKQIAAMEREMGVKLFERNYRSVRLTPAGEVMLAAFQRIAEEYEQSLSKARRICKEPRGVLNIGCLEELDLRFLPKALKAFQNEHPGVHLKIERYGFSALLRLLNVGALDLIITLDVEVKDRPDLERLTICEAPCAIIISRHHPLCGKKDLRPSDLRNERFFVIAPDESPVAKDFVAQVCARYGFAPKEIVIAPNIGSMLLSVETGLGVAIVDKLVRIYPRTMYRFLALEEKHVVSAAWEKNNCNPSLPLFIHHLLAQKKSV
ncbi:MAG: hypothetical protein PWQ41_1691 [Bacillota bacterium]|jgi:DNA-binding transcriptional LysR family regulator|nr:hypothetical protein [Bacillota bacterium]MDK2854904.1 hypothetical protein [Bacillota bacterium]MDK2925917.1 hypothetical protein [Bacillota bacterium]